MGVFNDLSENNQPLEVYTEQVNKFLLEGEIVEDFFILEVDYLAITNKRLILVYKNMSLKNYKTSIYSIPYKHIYSLGIVKHEKTKELRNIFELITKWATYDIRFLKNQDNIITIYNKINAKILEN